MKGITCWTVRISGEPTEVCGNHAYSRNTSTIGVLKATHWEQTPMPTIRNHTSAAIKTKTQSGYLQNAAYCRLKNAQIGYTLPKAWTKKAAMESVRVYVSGDNLLTISGISDIFDPETLGGDWGPGKLYPLQRTISIGLNVNF